jgi:hypothetical protein
MRFWQVCRCAVALVTWLPGAAVAHPFVDVQPFPPASAESGANYVLTLVVFPGDTPVASIQLDFEISAPYAFGAPSVELGEAFSFVYDPATDPLHFTIAGDFSSNPLPADGQFPVAEVTMLAGVPDETLSMLDASRIVALHDGVPFELAPPQFSNVFDDVVVTVVPEPSSYVALLSGGLMLVALKRMRARGDCRSAR